MESRKRNGLAMAGMWLCLSVCLVGMSPAAARAISADPPGTVVEDPGAGPGAVFYPCRFTGMVYDAATGAGLAGVAVSFDKVGGGFSGTAKTSSTGAYGIRVPEGSYKYRAGHADHVVYSSGSTTVRVRAPYIVRIPISPGIYREVTISSEATKSVNVRLSDRPTMVLLITTSLLDETADFDDTVDEYRDVVERTAGLEVHKIVLDSMDCLLHYGVILTDPTNANETLGVVREIARQTGPAYIIILGGTAVVPRPLVSIWTTPTSLLGTLTSDAWYADVDGDNIVDAGYAVSRMPEISTASEGVVAALETAIALHEDGGTHMSPEIRFSLDCWYPEPIGLGDACSATDNECGVCRKTPPYGACEDCDRRDEFFDLVSTSGFLRFTGHGNSTGFYTETRDPYFTIEDMSEVDLATHHPVIMAHTPCEAGKLSATTATLATEIMRAGAGAYVARTTTWGTPYYLGANLEPYVKGSGRAAYRIGDALFELMREAVLLEGGNQVKLDAQQVNLYGDPTLEPRVSWDLPPAGAELPFGH